MWPPAGLNYHCDKNNGENDEKALESDGKENGKPKESAGEKHLMKPCFFMCRVKEKEETKKLKYKGRDLYFTCKCMPNWSEL